jgi:hypothetical protein
MPGRTSKSSCQICPKCSYSIPLLLQIICYIFEIWGERAEGRLERLTISISLTKAIALFIVLVERVIQRYIHKAHVDCKWMELLTFVNSLD